MKERFLKIGEVSEVLKVHAVTVYKHIKEGNLKAVKVGKRSLRIAESELSRWLNRRDGDRW